MILFFFLFLHLFCFVFFGLILIGSIIHQAALSSCIRIRPHSINPVGSGGFPHLMATFSILRLHLSTPCRPPPTKWEKKGRDTFSNNLIFVLFFPRVSPDLFIRTWMFSFIFFLLVFSILFISIVYPLHLDVSRFDREIKKKTTTSVRRRLRGLSVSGRDQFCLQSDSFLDCINVWKLPALRGFFLSLFLFLSESIVDEFTSEMESLPFHGYWL